MSLQFPKTPVLGIIWLLVIIGGPVAALRVHNPSVSAGILFLGAMILVFIGLIGGNRDALLLDEVRRDAEQSKETEQSGIRQTLDQHWPSDTEPHGSVEHSSDHKC